MNPCPCGYLGDSVKACTCSHTQINAYNKKLSRPLLDRIDIRLTVHKAVAEHFFNTDTLQEKQLLTAKNCIKVARDAQKNRYKRSNYYNAYASIHEAKQLFGISEEAKRVLDTASRQLDLTGRSYLRVLRVARTIADLESSPTLEMSHISEALRYR